MAIDVDDILEIYSWTSAISEEAIESFIDDAYLETPVNTYTDYTDSLVKLLVAHRIFIEVKNNLAVTNSLTSIRTEATIHGNINFREGKDYYSQSPYGMQYLALKQRVDSSSFGTGIFVV